MAAPLINPGSSASELLCYCLSKLQQATLGWESRSLGKPRILFIPNTQATRVCVCVCVCVCWKIPFLEIWKAWGYGKHDLHKKSSSIRQPLRTPSDTTFKGRTGQSPTFNTTIATPLATSLPHTHTKYTHTCTVNTYFLHRFVLDKEAPVLSSFYFWLPKYAIVLLFLYLYTSSRICIWFCI
jgi:hypothetical protein